MDDERPAEVIKKPLNAIFTMVGGGLIALGSFLPWAVAPRPYGLPAETINGFTGGNLEGAFFLCAGAVIAAIGLARRYTDLKVWVQLLPLAIAVLVARVAYLDSTGIARKALPAYPGAYLGVAWAVLYLGAGFAVVGALRPDLRPKRPLPPLQPPPAPAPPPPTSPTQPPQSSVADVPGMPLSDWEEEQRRQQAEPFLAGETVDWIRLAQVLAVLGAVLGVIAMIGQSVGGGIAIVVCSEICALAMWLVGRRQARAS